MLSEKAGFPFYLFIWLLCALFGAHRLPLVAASGGCSSLPCMGVFSLWLLLLQSTGSRCTGFSVAAVHGLSNCDTRALLLHGMWNLPRSGIKPVSPALAGGFFTTEPPGKPAEMTFAFQKPILSHITCLKWAHPLVETLSVICGSIFSTSHSCDIHSHLLLKQCVAEMHACQP